MDSEDHVRASYNWSTVYKNVNLAGDGSLTFANSSTVTGSWHTDGRYGAVGPGNYHCEAPVVGYNGDFSMLSVAHGSITKLTIAPFMTVMGDHTQTTCSGLGSPPFASFVMMGHYAPNQAVVEFGIADLSAGPLSFNVGPQSALAPDCSDLPSRPEGVCSHSQEWSGKVTVTRAE